MAGLLRYLSWSKMVVEMCSSKTFSFSGLGFSSAVEVEVEVEARGDRDAASGSEDRAIRL